ncbi:autotransporter outer membrane beta-barrel domain-containing protein [Acidaminococcus sp.]
MSVEYGRTIPRGNQGWFVEPQAQFVFGHLGSNGYTTRRGLQQEVAGERRAELVVLMNIELKPKIRYNK